MRRECAIQHPVIVKADITRTPAQRIGMGCTNFAADCRTIGPGNTRLGVPSGRITDVLNSRRSITADTAVRLGRYFGNSPQFWLDLRSQHDIGVVERDKGAEIAKRVRPADAAWEL